MILIHNANILTINNDMDIIENGVIVVEGSTIKDIGQKDLILRYENKEGINFIDANGGIIMPGMVNCHTHGAMIHFRSLADDKKDRLKKYLFPLEKAFVDKDFVYNGSKYAIAELLLGGVTTFCDMYYFEDEVAKAADEMGIRGLLCETVVNFEIAHSKNEIGFLEYAKSFMEKWRNHKLITASIAPHATYTNNSESLKKAHKLSKEYNVPMTMHVAEMDFEFKECQEEYKMSIVKYLDSLGILDSKFIAAHSVVIDDSDIEIFKNRGVKISHNIGANSKGAKGVMPITKLLENEVCVGIGSDGPMSGNTIDVITQMPQIGKIHKVFNSDRSILPAKEIIKMATMGGAKTLSMENKIGSLEVGKEADIVIIETDSVNMQPIYDYYSTVVYCANPSNVDTVIIAGKILVKNKKLINYNLKDLREGLLEKSIVEKFDFS